MRWFNITSSSAREFSVSPEMQDALRKKLLDIGKVPDEPESPALIDSDSLEEIPGVTESETHTGPSKKTLFKQEVKKAYYKQKVLKFKRGNLYVIKAKNAPGLRFEKRIYECRQIVWTFNDKYNVSSIIVKQVTGPESSMTYLSQKDCKMLHIKYEPGLRIMSMYLNWQNYQKN